MKGIIVTSLACVLLLECVQACDKGYKKQNLDYSKTKFYEVKSSTSNNIRHVLKKSPKSFKASLGSDVQLTINSKFGKKVWDSEGTRYRILFDPSKFCMTTKCVSEIVVAFVQEVRPSGPLGSPLGLMESTIDEPCKFTKTCFNTLGGVTSIFVDFKYHSTCPGKCDQVMVKNLFMKACAKK